MAKRDVEEHLEKAIKNRMVGKVASRAREAVKPLPAHKVGSSKVSPIPGAKVGSGRVSLLKGKK